MNATINTFPPFQSMSSPRGWILAAIVLLHLGFFFVLSAGLVPDLFPKAHTESQVVIVPTSVELQDPPKPLDWRLTDTVISQPSMQRPDDVAYSNEPDTITAMPREPAPPQSGSESATEPLAPVVTPPAIDPRRALSEPNYPPRAIRENWTGTVILSVQVLENGRVGEVRLEQSSGYSALDESALREARKWRLKPGTKDGVPVAMWLQIPVTFQLQDGSRF